MTKTQPTAREVCSTTLFPNTIEEVKGLQSHSKNHIPTESSALRLLIEEALKDKNVMAKVHKRIEEKWY